MRLRDRVRQKWPFKREIVQVTLSRSAMQHLIRREVKSGTGRRDIRARNMSPNNIDVDISIDEKHLPPGGEYDLDDKEMVEQKIMTVLFEEMQLDKVDQ